MADAAMTRGAASSLPPVLVLRAEPEATRTAEALAATGHIAILAPLFEVVATGAPCPAVSPAAIIITSANAAPFLAAAQGLSRDVPLLAVGPHSADAARGLGFANVHVSASARLGLTSLLAGLVTPDLVTPDLVASGLVTSGLVTSGLVSHGAAVLAVLGQDRHEDWLGELAAAGFHVTVWTVYQSAAAKHLPQAAITALKAKGGCTALHFSRRSAMVFVELAAKAGLQHEAAQISHVAISRDVAEPLLRAGAHAIAVASTADLSGMIAALEHGKAFSLDIQPATRKDDRPENDDPAPGVEGVKESGSMSTADKMPETGTQADKPKAAGAIVSSTVAAGAMAEVPAARAAEIAVGAMSGQALPLPEVAVVEAEAPAVRQAAPDVARKTGPGWGGLILSGILGGVIGAGGLFEAQKHFGLSSGPAVPSVMPTVLPSAALQAASPQSASASPQLVALEARVAALDKALSTNAASPSTSLAAVAAPAAGASAAELQALTERLGRAEAASAQATQALQAAMPRLAGVETAARGIGAPTVQASGAAQLLLVERVRLALDAGRPFSVDVKALAANGVAAPMLQPLVAVAETGVMTFAQLRAELTRQRRVLGEDNTSQPTSWRDHALLLASRIVSVQKLDGPAPKSPPALVAAMDTALSAGDIQAAMSAWRALPEPARRAGEALGVSLGQRASAEAALKTLGDAAVLALTTPSATTR